MTPNQYQDLAARTDPDRTHQVVDKITEIAPSGAWLVHAHIGLSGEVGELAAAIQRWLYYNKELDRTNVIEELGDLCWYLVQACRAMDVKLEDVMEANINKLKFRYPERYTDFHAAEENRDRAGERASIVQEKALEIINEDLDKAARDREYQALHDYRESCVEAMAPRTGQEFIAGLTGRKLKQTLCCKCATPLSDRAVTCPGCGTHQ